MRIDATTPKCPDDRKFLFACDCSDTGCYVEVEWWHDEPHEDWPGFLFLTSTVRAYTIWERIKAIAKIIAGKRCYSNGVVLDDDTVNSLIETITEQRERKGKGNGEVQSAS